MVALWSLGEICRRKVHSPTQVFKRSMKRMPQDRGELELDYTVAATSHEGMIWACV